MSRAIFTKGGILIKKALHSGKIRPLSSTGRYQSYLWLREITAHLKCRGTAQARQANLKPPINDGDAPIWSDMSDKSDRSDTAPHQTLRHNQTAIQYWGAGLSVIPLAASDYRSPQVPGHRTNPPSKPQAPNQRGGAPTESDKSDKSDRSDMSDQAPRQTLMHNQTAFQYWGLGYQSYLWLREIFAYLKWRGTAPTRQANRKRPINDGGAPTESVNVRFSL